MMCSIVTTLENWCYCVEMGPRDLWRLSGRVFGHPDYKPGQFVYTSTPVSFDREKKQLVTKSGRHYQLGICAGREEDQFKYIEEDIVRGGSLVL